MPKLNAKNRAGLPDSSFAYIDSRGRRRLPINDEPHVRNALSRFNQVKFEDEAARDRARVRLLKAAKKYGIVPIGFMTGQLQSEVIASKRVLTDLKEAQKIQTGLLPAIPPEIPGFALEGVSLPSREVGGDWYDFLLLPDGRVGIVLADVAGKGVGAALLMSSTRSIVRMIAQDGRLPGEVLAEVNRVLVADLPAAKFVTMIYAILDPPWRTVTFAAAGHLPPILAGGAGARAVQVPPQLALGIRAGRYREHVLELPAGSRLFLYSDGVVEARNAASEEYGEERLLRFASSGASAQGLLGDVRRFMKRRAPVDDITVVSVEALPEIG
jgi:sigma-B regulation protein RsbU (phosphoserine phosphatase)